MAWMHIYVQESRFFFRTRVDEDKKVLGNSAFVLGGFRGMDLIGDSIGLLAWFCFCFWLVLWVDYNG